MENLERKIGYKFKNKKYLENALTHSSFNNSIQINNERMEFLGDKILAFIIAEIIYSYYYDKNEGYLSKAFSYFTSSNIMCYIGRDLGIYKYIKQNTEEEDNVIADSIEALISAIYLDSQDLHFIREFIHQHWKIFFDNYNEDKIYNEFNPKSVLQDWSQHNKYDIPKYSLIKKEGSDHNPIFYIKVEIKDFTPSIGSGKNKKIAEKNAAQKFIKEHNIISN